ncbi:hypothetical protein PILCRDRAFT_16718 [Piloderma croceum F 1598]|uniref:Uncharacterized protein n=1 Tax=Piloderma croceum (strain F 1598) TaxID=765440 RepID=A0A0C3B3D6_PILCF|nr:hypothetical protein PILCRDRAFT_16718 [Piloderma croceum F 1598]
MALQMNYNTPSRSWYIPEGLIYKVIFLKGTGKITGRCIKAAARKGMTHKQYRIKLQDSETKAIASVRARAVMAAESKAVHNNSK